MNRTAFTLKVILLVPVVLLGMGSIAFSQSTSADVPDLSGVWAWGRCVGAGFNCMGLGADDPRLTDRARGFRDAFDEIAAPKYDCAPMTIPHMFTDPYEYQIEQLADRVIITHEKDDVVRTVWLEGHGHPEPAVNQYFVHGYARGRYEGDTLVIETTRFTFDPTGLNSDFKVPSSTQKRVAESYTRDGEALLREVIVEDTFFLREPWEFTTLSQPVDGELSLPWNCDLDAARQTLRLVPSSFPDDPPIERIEQ